jgi:hypothetical protein
MSATKAGITDVWLDICRGNKKLGRVVCAIMTKGKHLFQDVPGPYRWDECRYCGKVRYWDDPPKGR